VVQRIDGFMPLGAYAALGDGRSCALVAADGAVDWWALPTMDSAPAFGALLDVHHGGTFVMRPVDDFEATRSYVDGGAVLATEFRTASGTVRVTDALTLGEGALLPWSEFARQVDAIDGEVAMRWAVAPGDRFSTTAAWARTSQDTPRITAGGQEFALVCDRVGPPERIDGGFRGTFVARPGESGLLAVVSTDGEPVPVPSASAIIRRIAATSAHWAGWSDLVAYQGPWREAVVRSALVHKQLTLAATGALQAAATTSLPERPGGSRNFDYRFCWVRDTGFAVDALTGVGLRGEVHAILAYLLRETRSTAPDVRVCYATSGGETGAEVTPVELWSGYRCSSPVQVGNNAASQRQLGSYGDLLEAIARYAAHGNVLDGATAQLVARIADQVCDQWQEPDAGLWELGEKRPYTSSKLGCWAALDRAIHLAGSGRVPDVHLDQWQAHAERIRKYINEACWSPAKRSYTFYGGTDDLDCATLLMARTGFCAPDDPRLRSTIEAIRSELSAGGPLLYRYTGMRDEEGAFAACSFWLVEALTVIGQLDEARQVMDGMVGLANDVGLLSEEIDPDTGELLGNLPQALSHLALISAAVRYQEAVSDATPV
jgi:GH15 family glucan-1,4-alpha-glucosidase